MMATRVGYRGDTTYFLSRNASATALLHRELQAMFFRAAVARLYDLQRCIQ